MNDWPVWKHWDYQSQIGFIGYLMAYYPSSPLLRLSTPENS